MIREGGAPDPAWPELGFGWTLEQGLRKGRCGLSGSLPCPPAPLATLDPCPGSALELAPGGQLPQLPPYSASTRWPLPQHPCPLIAPAELLPLRQPQAH